MRSVSVSIHVPLAEHDFFLVRLPAGVEVSIHVPLAEHDVLDSLYLDKNGVSIHVPLAEHDRTCRLTLPVLVVSIHVPLAEHDLIMSTRTTITNCFNSRAPRGARHIPDFKRYYFVEFQFTCPSRSTTAGVRLIDAIISFQFTCPSRSTTTVSSKAHVPRRFQFTCPSRSTTLDRPLHKRADIVSIHVPLAEHDALVRRRRMKLSGFNSRAPRGARRRIRRAPPRQQEFQFTCPSRSTTPDRTHVRVNPFRFNSRAPRGARLMTHCLPVSSSRFNSRAPRGARPLRLDLVHEVEVSIHVPLAEHDAVKRS